MALNAGPEGAGHANSEVGLASRADSRRDPARSDDGLGLQQDGQAPFPRCRQGGEVAPAVGILRDCGVHLQARRRHARHQQPVLRIADALPSALGRPAGVDQVFLPQRICDRGLLGRDRELRILNGLDGKQDLAE